MDFIYGGIASLLAIMVVHPIDVLKSRSQFRGETATTYVVHQHPKSLLTLSYRIAKEEGFSAFYRGLPAALALQFSVTAVRFGTYGIGKQVFPSRVGETAESEFARNFCLAGLSGGFGAIAGNVWFAIKTRQQVYSTSHHLREGTQHLPLPIFQELKNVLQNEGPRGLFRGLNAFLPRVVFYGAAQLSTYDFLKRKIATKYSLWSPFQIQTVASVGAAIVSVTVIQPFDFIAVRLQNQPIDPTTRRGLFYKGVMDCAIKTVRYEGGFGLFKGYPANLLRFGPYTVLIFTFVERLRIIGDMMFKKNGGQQMDA